MTRSEAVKLRKLIETASQSLSDNEALQGKVLYPTFNNLIGVDVAVGLKLTYNDKLYRVVQAHTIQADWTPDTATSLFEVIDETHDGTLEDPIPFSIGMELVEGLYYSENEKLYKCIRGTGQPIYNALADLVGIYVEIVK